MTRRAVRFMVTRPWTYPAGSRTMATPSTSSMRLWGMWSLRSSSAVMPYGRARLSTNHQLRLFRRRHGSRGDNGDRHRIRHRDDSMAVEGTTLERGPDVHVPRSGVEDEEIALAIRERGRSGRGGHGRSGHGRSGAIDGAEPQRPFARDR